MELCGACEMNEFFVCCIPNSLISLSTPSQGSSPEYPPTGSSRQRCAPAHHPSPQCRLPPQAPPPLSSPRKCPLHHTHAGGRAASQDTTEKQHPPLASSMRAGPWAVQRATVTTTVVPGSIHVWSMGREMTGNSGLSDASRSRA